jgi:hypothetical protein
MLYTLSKPKHRASILGGVEVGWIPVLPGPAMLTGVRGIGQCVAIPNAQFGGNIRDPTQRSGSCQFPRKALDIRRDPCIPSGCLQIVTPYNLGRGT